MKIIEIIRHLFGYIIGGTLFGYLIPFGIYKLSVFSNHFIRIGILENFIIRLLSGLLFLIGLFFAFWSNIYLFGIGGGGPTDAFGVAVSPRTKHLVVEGPYRYSRNPMVFGAFSCYFALAVFFNSIISVAVVILFFCIMIIILKFSEEKRLLRDFGEQYVQYKQKVSMIIPWPKR
jgi:protein-S-isoprenylcysteine O-methyltransferase Ste14